MSCQDSPFRCCKKQEDWKQKLIYLLQNDTDVQQAAATLLTGATQSDFAVPAHQNEELENLKNQMEEQQRNIQSLEQQRNDIVAAQRESERQLEEAKKKAEQLQARLNSMETERAQLQQDKDTLSAQLDRAQKSHLDQLNCLQEQQSQQVRRLTELEPLGCFQQTLDQYNAFCGVTPAVKEHLRRILPDKSLEAFQIYGCHMENLFNLWDYMKSDRETLSEGDFCVLKGIFAHFLSQVNKQYEQPIYALMTDEVGEPFDEERHIRSVNCNPYQGKVKRVLLEGVWNSSIKKVMRKCVVQY